MSPLNAFQASIWIPWRRPRAQAKYESKLNPKTLQFQYPVLLTCFASDVGCGSKILRDHPEDVRPRHTRYPHSSSVPRLIFRS